MEAILLVMPFVDLEKLAQRSHPKYPESSKGTAASIAGRTTSGTALIGIAARKGLIWVQARFRLAHSPPLFGAAPTLFTEKGIGGRAECFQSPTVVLQPCHSCSTMPVGEVRKPSNGNPHRFEVWSES
jgi:hypothetical protein